MAPNWGVGDQGVTRSRWCGCRPLGKQEWGRGGASVWLEVHFVGGGKAGAVDSWLHFSSSVQKLPIEGTWTTSLSQGPLSLIRDPKV